MLTRYSVKSHPNKVLRMTCSAIGEVIKTSIVTKQSHKSIPKTLVGALGRQLQQNGVIFSIVSETIL